MIFCDVGVGLNVLIIGRLFDGNNLWVSKNWLRRAKCRETCMGIGTMIFEADILLVLFEAAGEFAEVIEVDEADDDKWHVPVFMRFHFARRFWNQIFTCTSLRPSLFANSDLSFKVRYFFDWNSCSNSCNWYVEKAVLRLRFPLDFPPSKSAKIFLKSCTTTYLFMYLSYYSISIILIVPSI